MTTSLARSAQRFISALVLLAVALLPMLASAQDEKQRIAQAIDQTALLVRTGRNLDAVDLLKRTVETAPPTEREAVYQAAGMICVILWDVDCAQSVLTAALPFIETLRPSEQAGRNYLLILFYQVVTGQLESTRSLIKPQFVPRLASSVPDPLFFAELSLIAARRARLAADFTASRDHLDRALVGTLSLTGDVVSQAPRLVMRIVSDLLENYDVERALRLMVAAEPMFKWIPEDSLLFYDLLQLRAALLGFGRKYVEASNELRLALSKLDRLQLRTPLKARLKAGTYNYLLGLEVLAGNFDAARTLLQSHPLMESKPAIRQRGYFATDLEFDFALAEEFVRFALGDSADTGWGDLMRQPVRWTTNADEIRSFEAFAQAAIGLQLARQGRTDEARHELEQAARKRLAGLQDTYRKSIYASPLPRWPDLVLLELAMAATLSSDSPDYDLVVQAHVVTNRSLETSADDALAYQAVQLSDERRRTAQALRTTQYQRAAWETAELLALTQRLAGDQRSPDSVRRDRHRILYSGSQFLSNVQQLRTALESNRARDDVDSIGSLATVRDLLLPDEALVLYAPMLNRLGKVCVRTDRILSSTQAVDDSAVADARLLVAALTATHPASVETDSQFPVVEAVRMGKLLFGGLDDCLRSSRRVYLLASSRLMGQVPPAALLTELPPAMGSGFDLRAAHWMIRDHAFVRATSISAFVATKRLAKSRRATLDYLGVGDPVLERRGDAALSGGELAARGSLHVRSGPLNSLQELPETSEELQGVVTLFDKSRAWVLRRDMATEENFRLQPLSEFDTIHFATHGLVKEEYPGLREPSLVLTPDAGGDAFNDGLLTGTQIGALPLRARLVVLSACNSARYEPSIIDSGIQGLSTSFAIAGVPSMVASLWPIESSLTRDLIVDAFRAARSDDAPIADTLAIAIRRHLDGPTARPLLHPRFWAALIVVGDGSTKLNQPGENLRDLGAFRPVNPSQHATVLSAAAFGDRFVTSTVGRSNGRRFASLIRRQAIDGTTEWEIVDDEIGAGPIAASQGMIYAGGHTASAAVLRGIRPDGQLAWSYRFADQTERPSLFGLAATNDQSVVALVGPASGQKSEGDFGLVRVGIDGRQTARVALSLPVSEQSVNSGYLGIGNGVGLAVVNREPWLKSGTYMADSLGNAVQCLEGDAAEVVFFDAIGLAERKRTRIDGFRVRSAITVDDGWVLVGDGTDSCGTLQRAAAYRIRDDGSVEQLWRDASPYETAAKGVRKTAGMIEIVGYAARSMGSPEQVEMKSDLDKLRQGNEDYVSGEVLSVMLSEQGVEQRRDFVGAGLPIVPTAVASNAAHSAILGSVGWRALWMAR
jgi:hypothetical protein